MNAGYFIYWFITQILGLTLDFDKFGKYYDLAATLWAKFKPGVEPTLEDIAERDKLALRARADLLGLEVTKEGETTTDSTTDATTE